MTRRKPETTQSSNDTNGAVAGASLSLVAGFSVTLVRSCVPIYPMRALGRIRAKYTVRSAVSAPIPQTNPQRVVNDLSSTRRYSEVRRVGTFVRFSIQRWMRPECPRHVLW